MRSFIRVTALAVLLLGSTHSAMGDVLTPEETKWVRACMDRLDSNSPRVRHSAERALVDMGREILPAVVANLKRIKGSTAESGLMRVMMGLGRGPVLQRLTAMARDARSGDRKRIEAFMDTLGESLGVGEPLQVTLASADLMSGDSVPHHAEFPLDQGWPKALLPGGGEATVKAGKLHVTPSGGPETVVKPGTPALIRVTHAEQVRSVLVFDKADRWFAASASLRVGDVRKLQVSFWDVDLDGRFDGPQDMARIAPGTWQLMLPSPRLAYDDHVLAVKLNVAQDVIEATLTLEAAPTVRASMDLRFLRALHRWRAKHGLGPLRYDTARSKACMEHTNYLAINNNNPAAVRGGASHHQVAGLPGTTPAGAEAGRSSVLLPSGLDRMVRANAITMLHRIAWLAPAGSGLGVGSARKGRAAWSAVWSERSGPTTDPRLVTVPAPGATSVPRAASSEWPPPDQPPGWYGQRRGYPISVTYAHLGMRKPTLQVFRLDENGKVGDSVAGRVWSPEQPIAAAHHGNGGTVFFMAERPLESETAYRATFVAQGGNGPVRFDWLFHSR